MKHDTCWNGCYCLPTKLAGFPFGVAAVLCFLFFQQFNFVSAISQYGERYTIEAIKANTDLEHRVPIQCY